jgi:hypothetical protein
MLPRGVFCLCCSNTRWVCEAHPCQPWTDTVDGCMCSAGEPCPNCNDEALPAMPDGFVAEAVGTFDPLLEIEEDEGLRKALAWIEARAKLKIN